MENFNIISLKKALWHSSQPSQQNATVFWDMLLFCAIVAQKVAVRQKRQVATVYAYFYAAAVLQ